MRLNISVIEQSRDLFKWLFPVPLIFRCNQMDSMIIEQIQFHLISMWATREGGREREQKRMVVFFNPNQKWIVVFVQWFPSFLLLLSRKSDQQKLYICVLVPPFLCNENKWATCHAKLDDPQKTTNNYCVWVVLSCFPSNVIFIPCLVLRTFDSAKQ